MTNDMQQNAIRHTMGPARVLAGPGSGKTFTIIQRLHFLINSFHIPPKQILCITFTKAAAVEMQNRYQSQIENIDINISGSVSFGTVHSICFRILKESGKFLHYSLIQEPHQRQLVEQLLLNKGVPEYNNFAMITEILHAFGRKRNGLPYREEDCLPKEQFEEIYREYTIALTERQLLDFDDIIIKTKDLLIQNEATRKKFQNRFSYIIVDEFQDINETQYEVIKLLSLPRNNLFVVGDDDQAIYGFRGALPNIMKHFNEDFPDAKDYYLTYNYRSCEKIVSFAERIISMNTNRIPKHFIPKKEGGFVNIYYEETRKEEEITIITHLKGLQQKVLESSALIVRTNVEATQYIRLLQTHQIPVKDYSEKTKNQHLYHFIKQDFEAFLSFCKEGRKRSDFIKIMNKPEKYLSRQSLVNEKVTIQELLNYYRNNQKMQITIKQLFERLQKAENMSFSMAIRYFRNIIGYDNYLKSYSKNTQEYEEFLKIADELQLLCKFQKGNESCKSFWQRIEREYENLNTESKKSKVKNGISVITMHGAKGLEFSQVFLPDVNEGIIPSRQCHSKESIEEERRLLYVAVTRAKEVLSIYYTKERGRRPSRFLDYSSASISSSNSTPSRYSSNASATASYSSSSSI